MKKILCLITMIALCVLLAVPAFAVDFVPSITYKDGPDVEDAVTDVGTVKSCVVITSIIEAQKKTTDIPQERRDQLLDLYKKIDGGDMKLPVDNEIYVVRELVDVSYKYTGCEETHEHEDWLSQPGNTVTVEMDLGIPGGYDVVILVYVDGQWQEVERVIPRGNGIFSVTFEDFGPMAVCVDIDAQATPPKTGDSNGNAMILWGGLLVGSLAAAVVLLILFKRSKDDDNK